MKNEREENNEMTQRSVILVHDQSDESREIIGMLTTRSKFEELKMIDATQFEWDESFEYKIPFVFTPEGVFEGRDGVQRYLEIPDDFRNQSQPETE